MPARCEYTSIFEVDEDSDSKDEVKEEIEKDVDDDVEDDNKLPHHHMT
jgi:hypothetical protein